MKLTILNRHKLAIITFFLSMLPSIFLVNTIWSPTQGWYYEWASYIRRGLIPYRDFYVPFPPLFVYINTLFQNFSDPLLVERICMLAIYSLMSVGLYKLLSNFFSSGISLSSTLLSCLIFQLSATNTIAGYFETALMFEVWGFHLYLKNSFRKKFIGGIFLVCASLIKQIFVVPAILIFIREVHLNVRHRKFPKDGTFFGVLAGYVLFSIYLLHYEIFGNFLSIMIQGGGKNPNFHNWMVSMLAPSLIPRFLFISAIIIVAANQLQAAVNSKKDINKSLFAFYYVAFLYIGIFNSPFSNRLQGRASIPIFALLWFLTYLVANKIFLESGKRLNISATLTIFSIPLIAFLVTEIFARHAHQSVHILQNLLIQSEQGGALLTSVLWNIGLISIFATIYITKTGKKLLSFKQLAINIENLNFVLISLSGVLVLNAFNGGVDFNGNIILGAFGIGIFIMHFKEVCMKNYFTLPASILISISALQIGFVQYSWFGWNESLQLHPVHAQTKVEIFRNFKLTDYEVNFYSKIENAITEAIQAERNRGIENPKLMSFPMQPITNHLATVNLYSLHCPILHFDICPDNQARIDYENIKTKLPDIIVLYDLGEDYIKSNESVWRSGKISVYRKIQNYILDSGQYRIVEEIKSDKTNLANIKVLIKM